MKCIKYRKRFVM